jgi:HlyD family secretion protein
MDRILEKRRFTPRRIAVLGVSGLFLLVILYNVILGDHSSKLNVAVDRITISTVENGDFQEFITVTGTVVPVRSYYLDAIEGGRVDTAYLEAGSYVNRGDKIIKLANTSLLMDIMYREAELVQQSNNLRNTKLAMAQQGLATKGQLLELDTQIKKQKRVYDNYCQLIERKLIAQQEFEETKDDYEYLLATRELTLQQQEQDSIYREAQIQQLEANLSLMESNMKMVRLNMENLTIRAPISGNLTALNARIGETKSRGERLGQIDILDSFKIRVPVDEHYISRVNTGLKGDFPYEDSTYNLVVEKVFPEVVDGRFEVEMAFDGPAPTGMRRGQTFRVRLELGDLSRVLLLPRGGFYQKTGGQWVFVVDPSGEVARRRFISLGRKSPLYFEVLEGLEPGEKVITSPYDSFGEVETLVLEQQ